MKNCRRIFQHRPAISLLELLVVVVLAGILAAIAISRIAGATAVGDARKNACYTLKGNLEVQAQLWRREKGVWPAADLSDLAADPAYLPEGLPVCPFDGSAYAFDPATSQVVGHNH